MQFQFLWNSIISGLADSLNLLSFSIVQLLVFLQHTHFGTNLENRLQVVEPITSLEYSEIDKHPALTTSCLSTKHFNKYQESMTVHLVMS